jgi:peptide/nickel transport system permease protein
MIAFSLRRAGAAVVVGLALVAVVFLLQEASEFDPVRAKVGAGATTEVVEAERERLGYNDPLPQRYADYVADVGRGDLGTSLRTGRPVAEDVREFAPASLELVLVALVIGLPIALLLGVASAARWRGSGVFKFVVLAGASAPSFLLALVGVILLFKTLHLLPSSGRVSVADPPDGPTSFLLIDGVLAGRPAVVWDAATHALLPAIAIALAPAAAVGRVLRSALIVNLRSDQVRTARAKGLTDWQVIARHCMRNSAGPTLAMGGLMLGLVFANLAVVETIFSWPGLGAYVAQSIPKGDFPAIAGVTLLFGLLYVLVNTAVDILQAAADPRIKDHTRRLSRA